MPQNIKLVDEKKYLKHWSERVRERERKNKII
jgi:hypothetical protein